MRRYWVVGVLLLGTAVPGSTGTAATSSYGRMAFTSGSDEAYVSELDGRRPRVLQLPPYSVPTTTPSWDPAGRQIALGAHSCVDTDVKDVLGNCAVLLGNLVVSSIDGRAPRSIVQLPGTRVAAVSWSPDGGRLALEVQVGGGFPPSTLMLVDRDGSGLRPLVPGEHPAWAPDGRRIAYVGPDRGVHVVDPDGLASPLRVSPQGVQAGLQRQWTAPTWSPDGRWIAFAGQQSTTVTMLWVVRADGTGGRAVPRTMDVYDAPKWSPDSTRFVYTSPRGVWVSAPDGSRQRRLVTSTVTSAAGPARFANLPAWSPDGRWIGFQYEDRRTLFRSHRTLRLIRPDGSGLRTVALLQRYDDPHEDWVWANFSLEWAPRT